MYELCTHSHYCNLNTSIKQNIFVYIYFELWIKPHLVNINL